MEDKLRIAELETRVKKLEGQVAQLQRDKYFLDQRLTALMNQKKPKVEDDTLIWQRMEKMTG